MLSLWSPVNRLPLTKQQGQPNIFFCWTRVSFGASSVNSSTSPADDFSQSIPPPFLLQCRTKSKRAQSEGIAARRKRNSATPVPTRTASVLDAGPQFFRRHRSGLFELVEVPRWILARHQRWLYQHRKTNGQPLTFRTQQRLRALKGCSAG